MHSASALFSGAAVASTPPQHTPTRPPRRTTSGTSSVVAFRSSIDDPTAAGTAGAATAPPGPSSSFSRGDSVGSWRSSMSGLSRTASRPSASTVAAPAPIPKSDSFVKVEGFAAPESESGGTSSAPSSPVTSRRPATASSLLSRQLSEDHLPVSPGANAGPVYRPVASTGALASLAEDLEESVEKGGDEDDLMAAPLSPRADADAQRLLAQLASQFEVFREALVERAFFVAWRANDGRPAALDDAETPFSRATGAATILAELGGDEVAVAAALLHDVLDAGPIGSADQLVAMLGRADAADTVARVSHIEYICARHRSATPNAAVITPQLEAKESEIVKDSPDTPLAPNNNNNTSQLVSLLVAQGPPRALLVRLAVALQDARALDSRPAIAPRSWSAQGAVAARAARRAAAAAEAIALWAPLANRLGVWSLKAELEDRAFRALHAAEYAELRDRLERVQDPTRLVGLVDALRAALHDAGVEYLDLSGRPKHLWGVWRKMRAKGCSTERVRDVCGLRVIVRSREDCYRALRAVETAWKVAGLPKNYIKSPKANGYQSLHAVADPGDGHPVEIQIRTDKMHYLAEYGAEAGHWRYKEGGAAGAAATASVLDADDENNTNANATHSSSPADGVAREAIWAKFLTSQHVARDMKTRPSGSPSEDTSLSSIMASISIADEPADPQQQQQQQQRRTFQQYIAATGQRPAPPSPEERRVLVAVVVGDAFSVVELPAGTTLGALLRRCGADLVPSTCQMCVVVNRGAAMSVTAATTAEAAAVGLRAGDVVELRAAPAPAAAPGPMVGNALPLGGLARKFQVPNGGTTVN